MSRVWGRMKRKTTEGKNNKREISVRKRLRFGGGEEEGEISEADEEVTINHHAHKRRKLLDEMEEIKVWFQKEFDTQLTTKLANVATSTQVDHLGRDIRANSEQIVRNKENI